MSMARSLNDGRGAAVIHFGQQPGTECAAQYFIFMVPIRLIFHSGIDRGALKITTRGTTTCSRRFTGSSRPVATDFGLLTTHWTILFDFDLFSKSEWKSALEILDLELSPCDSTIGAQFKNSCENYWCQSWMWPLWGEERANQSQSVSASIDWAPANQGIDAHPLPFGWYSRWTRVRRDCSIHLLVDILIIFEYLNSNLKFLHSSTKVILFVIELVWKY